MSLRLRVLCLDIEGGHGGSSRSLFEALREMDRSVVAPEVWCRRAGDIVEHYRELGIPARVETGLPKASALPRWSRNMLVIAGYLMDFARSAEARGMLARVARARFDLVHFNHEAFAGLAYWLRHRVGVPATMHIRTNLVDTPFSRLQNALISRAVDRRVFITANEEANYRRIGGQGLGRVVLNPARVMDQVEPHPCVPQDGRFNVASISNYAFIRGTDRLIDIARLLNGPESLRFVVAGDMRIDRKRTMQDEVRAAGVSDRFLFLGHVSEPERVLAACHCLIKPTREANPWGRDIIEAMAQGRPVISYGRDATFVENGVTGVLMEQYDAARTAVELRMLAASPERIRSMGESARQRVRALCDPGTQAAALAEVWREAVAARRAA